MSNAKEFIPPRNAKRDTARRLGISKQLLASRLNNNDAEAWAVLVDVSAEIRRKTEEQNKIFLAALAANISAL